MKLKDIEPGGYYWTRCTRYEPTRPVRVVEVVEVPTYSGWTSRKPSGSIKKVLVVGVRLGGDGSISEGRPEKMMPGKLASPAERAQVLARLVANKKQKDAARENIELAKEYAPAMAKALADAGFAGAVVNFNGVRFDRAAVAKWAITGKGAE